MIFNKCNKRCNIEGVATPESKCLGCGRTLQEIRLYGQWHAQERRKAQLREAICNPEVCH